MLAVTINVFVQAGCSHSDTHYTGTEIGTPILQACRLTGKGEVIIVILFWGILTYSFDFLSYLSTDIFFNGKN